MSHRKRRWIGYHGATPPPPTGRRYYPGIYSVLLRSMFFNGNTYLGIPNGAIYSSGSTVWPGLAGVMVPHDWNEVEPNGATDPIGTRFDFSRVAAEVAQCAAAGVQYLFKLNVKSFRGLGTNPLPADLQTPIGSGPSYSPDGRATYFAGSGGTGTLDGYSIWRWDPVIIARMNVLFQQMGAVFDTNPYFGGIVTQETAIAYTAVPAVDNYSPAAYMDGLIAEGNNFSAAFPHARHFCFINFMHGVSIVQARYNLFKVAATLQPNGTVIAGPDLTTELSSANITSRCYPIYNDYHFGTSHNSDPAAPFVMPSTGPTGCSIQHAEWGGNETPADPRPVLLKNLFNYATSSNRYPAPALDHRPGSAQPSPLNLDYLFIDYHTANTAGTPPATWNPDATDIMADNLTPFGNWTP